MKYIILTYIKASLVTLSMISWSGYANMTKSVTFPLHFEEYDAPYTTFIINGNPVYAMVDTGSKQGFHLKDEQWKKIAGLTLKRAFRSTDAAGHLIKNKEYIADTLNSFSYYRSTLASPC